MELQELECCLQLLIGVRLGTAADGWNWNAEAGSNFSIAADRLPTKKALRRRNIHLVNAICVLCEDGKESIDHLLIACGFASGVWQYISKWCGVPLVYAFPVKDLVERHTYINGSAVMKKVFQGIVIITAWSIWKETKRKAILEQKEDGGSSGSGD
ncbi:uncharacterized protein LOC110883278 [Helianthus annuus]|uniref:uncharacterized protein LOC110883278 n=1 Tax=Helianthus annuus TaxID=4232 RepID=UPI000B901ED4|nr:uncharacterized protein LOC110883278 [Helianthus annuus]